jgi:hypothetical protein
MDPLQFSRINMIVLFYALSVTLLATAAPVPKGSACAAAATAACAAFAASGGNKNGGNKEGEKSQFCDAKGFGILVGALAALILLFLLGGAVIVLYRRWWGKRQVEYEKKRRDARAASPAVVIAPTVAADIAKQESEQREGTKLDGRGQFVEK